MPTAYTYDPRTDRVVRVRALDKRPAAAVSLAGLLFGAGLLADEAFLWVVRRARRWGARRVV